jgi:hypothetical protein
MRLRIEGAVNEIGDARFPASSKSTGVWDAIPSTARQCLPAGDVGLSGGKSCCAAIVSPDLISLLVLNRGFLKVRDSFKSEIGSIISKRRYEQE